MKYVALLSGGKDSCYNLLHCARNGHELIAAASLGPELGKEELDSYLYQTVGQDAIEFVARALEVPLYRQVISGGPLEQGSEYGDRNAKVTGGVQGDETEDLYDLLSTVKSQHPEVQGVSVGAILSNYQRVRVEHVCRRLALTPLCYLWQRNQGDLLSEMINAGMEAILIKVAGIGLTTKHLGKTLSDMQPTLIKLNDLYGSHICGEGGEYESLTLDCPLFKHRIILTEVETVIHSDNDFATVAFLRIKNATLEQKPDAQAFDLPVPSLLTDNFTAVRDAVLQSQDSLLSVSNPKLSEPVDSTELLDFGISSKRLGSWVAITDIQSTSANKDIDISIEDEVRECFQTLRDCLAEHSLQLAHCANINIFLSSMDVFARVNTVYASFFGISPPARACVAVDLRPPIRVKLDCVAYAESTSIERQALHVQGLSYWAPANIGPYSQAITVDQRIFISGQIGLIPSSLALPSPQSLALESALAFQHVEHVTDALRNNSGGGWAGHTQAVLYWLANSDDLPHIKRAHEVISGPDAPTLFLVVRTLPKGALVEKQVLLHTGRCLVSDGDGDDHDGWTLQPRKPSFERYHSKAGTLHWEVSRFDDNTASSAIICIRDGDKYPMSDTLKAANALNTFWTRTLSIRLFYVPSRASSFPFLFQDLFGPEGRPPIISIPCRFISTKETNSWDYAICILGA